jgi:hypothetical protein
MRLALLSLTAAAVATVAFAQEAPAPAMQAPAAPAPAADPMAAQPAPAAPADQMAAPVAPVAEAPPAAPPEQQLAPMPTDPEILTVIDAVEKVCKPSVMGGDLNQLAKANGFAMKRKLWTKAMATKPYQIVVQPKSVANPNVCTLTIDFPIGQGQEYANGLHAWASRQDPIMQSQNVYAVPPVGKTKRTTLSWETKVAGPYTAMSVGLLKTADDKPVLKNADQAELLFQYRPQ